MYIDFHKFNYSTVPPEERSRYEQRDKEAYKEVLKDWLNSNLALFTDRKWEIEEIHYLKEIGEFIKLVREAESLYELGFFTGCIALIGVSAEDFSKYLSLKKNRVEHLERTYTGGKRKGKKYDVSQHERLRLQLNEGIITQEAYDLLDQIRVVRNDCLHYNHAFKKKSEINLKSESIRVLNALKAVLKDLIGNEIDPKDISSLMEETFQKEHSRSFEELIWKQKNLLSHLIDFPLTHDPAIKKIRKANFYYVSELDEDEISLTEVETNPHLGIRLSVIVDLDECGKKLVFDSSTKSGDLVFAVIYSNIAADGQSRFWFLQELSRLVSAAR